MKKVIAPFVFFIALSLTGHSQLMVSKLIGKNTDNEKLGYGVFAYYEFPMATENNSIRLELMDFAYYPLKNSDLDNIIGYLSIKGGYKHVFSETNTGWYIEPSAGWVRVVLYTHAFDTLKAYGDGLALALEGGYSLGVGAGDNTINFGLKYESDIAGSLYTANSIGFRVSFSFHLFRKKNDY